MMHARTTVATLRSPIAFLLLLGACGGGETAAVTPPVIVPPVVTQPPLTPPSSGTLQVLGQGQISNRFTAEISVGGRYAYSSTWGTRSGVSGNAVFIWDLSAEQPRLIDSVIVAAAGTTGDVQAVPDANLLVVAIEPTPRGAMVLYDITQPDRPQLIGRYETPNTVNGVHTAQVARVDGRLYAFLCVNPRGSDPARLVIVDITDPRAPAERWVQALGSPFVHDVFVRDGILLTAEWNNGMAAYDIGGGARGGSIASPVFLSRVLTFGGSVHNVYWYRDAVSGARFAFVGEEGPGAVGGQTVGDIHVVDVTSWSAMKEVAYYSVTGAGTHNFWVDEAAGVLYAAYYNAGVRALDVRGDLAACAVSGRDALGRCDLAAMNREVGRGLTGAGAFVWGVDGAGGSVMVSDMLQGVIRMARVVR